MLWHCKRCWNKHHNGEKHNDYEPPKFYGQSMLDDDLIETMDEKHGIKHNPSIEPHEEIEYDEGMYGH